MDEVDEAVGERIDSASRSRNLGTMAGVVVVVVGRIAGIVAAAAAAVVVVVVVAIHRDEIETRRSGSFLVRNWRHCSYKTKFGRNDYRVGLRRNLSRRLRRLRPKTRIDRTKESGSRNESR